MTNDELVNGIAELSYDETQRKILEISEMPVSRIFKIN